MTAINALLDAGASQGAAMPTATREIVPDRSPPDVTAAIVAITDQARSELRDVSGRVCAAIVHATVAIVVSLVVGGAGKVAGTVVFRAELAYIQTPRHERA